MLLTENELIKMHDVYPYPDSLVCQTVVMELTFSMRGIHSQDIRVTEPSEQVRRPQEVVARRGVIPEGRIAECRLEMTRDVVILLALQPRSRAKRFPTPLVRDG
jgi:hypothetical protein